MAVTVTHKPGRMILTTVDDDWVWTRAIILSGVMVMQGAANDKILLQEDSITGAAIIEILLASADAHMYEFPVPFRCTPAIDISSCVVTGTPTVVLFVMGY